MLRRFFSNKISRFSTAALLAATALLAGCGGGGAGAAGAAAAPAAVASQTITGTAATGVPLVGATVTIKDSSAPPKTASGISAAGGVFNIAVTGMTPPFMLEAAPAVAGQSNMYSILPAMNMTATATQNVNITPVTTLVMYELNNGADPGNMFRTAGFAGITSVTTVENTATTVRNVLASKLPIVGVTALNAVPSGFSMMYGNFIANGVNVYDKALDNIGKITGYAAGGASLTAAPSAVATATYAPSNTGAGGAAPTAASFALSAAPTTVKSDGSTTTTITVTALSAANAAVPGVTVNLSASTGILGAPSVVTGATGSGTVAFSSDASRVNRTATITATAGAATAQIPVQIVGSTLTLGSTGLTLPDNGLTPVTLTVTPKDPAATPVVGAAVSLTQTGPGMVTITPASGVTGVNGTFTATVSGVAGKTGAVTINASALGSTATTALTVSPAAATFGISQQTLTPATCPPLLPPCAAQIVPGNPAVTAMKIGDSLAITVNAPAPAANVTFATTTGVWNGLTAIQTVPVVAGVAAATLTTTQAGVATVQVYDPLVPATSAMLTVGMTAATASSITLQPSPAVVTKKVGATAGSSTLIAMVRDSLGFPVGGAPVAFSIVNPTGGGETVTPVVAFTAATTAGGLNLGEVRTSFTSGSLSSPASGVQIRASVVGASLTVPATGCPGAVVTATCPCSGGVLGAANAICPVTTQATGVNFTPSGSDATIVIGGTAGSVAFGQSSTVGVGGNNTTYTLPMSVLVADSAGNPAPLGTVVNLSVWPIAWSTGPACSVTGTYFNEDNNENLFLDPGEDGTRKIYPGGAVVLGGKLDGLLTPPNSAGGTLPASVVTDASGVATFSLTYLKGSAIWTTVRVRATTVVQGSATVGETIFPLPALQTDVVPACLLGNSPYVF